METEGGINRAKEVPSGAVVDTPSGGYVPAFFTVSLILFCEQAGALLFCVVL
jgi:hypothetical protein